MEPRAFTFLQAGSTERVPGEGPVAEMMPAQDHQREHYATLFQ